MRGGPVGWVLFAEQSAKLKRAVQKKWGCIEPTKSNGAIDQVVGMANVVVVTHWLDGDVIPYVRIGTELKRRGHHVTLVTHCHFAGMAEKAGLDFVPWDTPEEYDALVDLMYRNKDDHAFQSSNFSYSSNEFRQSTENIQLRLKEYKIVDSCCQSPDTVLLCKSRSSVAAYMVAEKRKLPLATVIGYPSEVASMLLFEDLEGKNDVPRLNELRKAVGLDPIDSWLQWEGSAKMTLALWPDWFDHVDDQWPTKIDPVGFPLEQGKAAYQREIPEDFANWLEKNPNPILITGGTTTMIDASFYTSSIEACGIIGQPTVVLCKYDEFIPKELPSNVVWYKYIPLDEIMPKLSVLIHHGGIGTVTGGMAIGIPQLILPGYGDRPYNATLIKEQGVGDYLLPGNWQPEKVADMIRSLMANRGSEKYRICVEKMAENRGISVAADRVEQMIGNDDYVYSIKRKQGTEAKQINTSESSEKKAPGERIQKLTDEQRARLRLSLKKRENK